MHGGICGQNLAARAYSCYLLKSLVRLIVLTISARSMGSFFASLSGLQDDRSLPGNFYSCTLQNSR